MPKTERCDFCGVAFVGERIFTEMGLIEHQANRHWKYFNENLEESRIVNGLPVRKEAPNDPS